MVRSRFWESGSAARKERKTTGTRDPLGFPAKYSDISALRKEMLELRREMYAADRRDTESLRRDINRVQSMLWKRAS